MFATVALTATAVNFTGCASAPPPRLSSADVKAAAIATTIKILNEPDFIPVDENGNPIQRKDANGKGIVDANGLPVHTQYTIRIGYIINSIPFLEISPRQLTSPIIETLLTTHRLQPIDGENADFELTGQLFKNDNTFFIRLSVKCLRPIRERQTGTIFAEKTYEVKPQQKQ